MEFLIIIAAALLPAILFWGYIWKMDRKKEPTPLLVKATCYGVLICLPVAMVESMISGVLFDEGGPTTLFGATVDAFMVAAIPEEAFKLFALHRILKNNPYFDEHFDGIVYAVCVGLGFAGLENILYLFDNAEDWLSVAFLRSLMAVPGHYAFAVLMGYYYSVYHFVNRSRRTWAMILVAPVLAHGLYDALLMSAMVNAALGGICFCGAVYLTYRLHIYARKKVLAMVNNDKQNPLT
ncbi:MAG: PrsW family intramembrane metalloprotease [Prevotella sp.]|nr:PrsW family intramembrane metalloprotease [Prevotella sp.]